MDKERRTALFTQVERVTEIPMLALAFLFLIIILFPEVTELSLEVQNTLESLLWIIWGVFAVELILKTYLAPERFRYLVSHWPDVLTVAVPFLRPIRLLRIFFVTARVWKQIRSVLRQQTLSLVGFTSMITVAISATLVYIAERQTDGPIETYADALWWAVTTITTVGYGDMYPTTGFGRGIAVFLMLTGITLFGLLTASVAAFFIEEDTNTSNENQLEEIMKRLDDIEQKITQQNGHEPNEKTAQPRNG